jgi:hypothetical protein
LVPPWPCSGPCCARTADWGRRFPWFSPRDAEGRFALSEDTRSKGLWELGNAGLVTTKRRPVNETDFQAEALYMRNVHFLRLERLSDTAAITPRRRVVRVLKRLTPAEDDE